MSAPVVTLGHAVPSVSRSAADEFVRTWLGGVTGKAIVTRISSAGRHIVRSWAFEVPELLNMINGADDFDTLCLDPGGAWNVYVSCSTHDVDPTRGGKARGGKQTVKGVHGCWLDLDVKSESFSGGAREIDAFLAELPVAPTLVVGSGSGGRHAYWRFEEGALSVADGEAVCEAWWALAAERAGARYVDKITTADRIMRLPGTVRWPKTDGETAGRVEIVTRGSRVPISRIWDESWSAAQRLRERREEVRERTRESRQASNLKLGDLAAGVGWNSLVALAHVEDIFNATTSWDTILVPFGWHCVGNDYEGRRHWARPGQTQKSAHTDYPPQPHVMNLFSNSLETGLSELSDADVPLTKFTVYAQLAYGGDAEALIASLLRDEMGARA